MNNMTVQTYNLTNENVTLTAYILDSSKEMERHSRRGAVLVCPGGAYAFCSDREGEPVAAHFLSMGYNAFVLRYSLNENAKFPQPLNDADEAFAFIVDNAEKFNIYPDKIAVCGFSAGGHLAASLGTMGKIRPAGMILGYACVTEDICNISNVLVNGGDLPLPNEFVDSKTPPAFIFASADDTCVPVRSSLAMAQSLSDCNIPFELHIYENGGHGFSTADYVTNNYYDSPCSKWLDDCRAWLYRLFFN